MEFKSNEAIYLQIADYISERILLNKWATDEKIPSVREMAGILEVNPNTVMRSYEQLQQAEIIYNKRGLGFFVSKKATRNIKKNQQAKFMDHELPQLFKNMYLLDISIEEITNKYKSYLEDKIQSNTSANENEQ